MLGSVRSHQEEEEDDGEDGPLQRPTNGSYQKAESDGQKQYPHRSKHSETEQRRRSRINERFQILRDIIPQNDQKRDKASFLLEVIQYIQFLHEKVQIYEGSCQGWSQDPSKMVSWRNNCGPPENFIDRTELMGDEFSQESNIVVTPAIFNRQRSVESDLREPVSYKAREHLAVAAHQTLAMDTRPQQSVHVDFPVPHQALVSNSEQLDPRLHSQFWQARSCTTDNTVPSYSSSEEDPKHENGEAMISNAYSQGLLNTLSAALQSSGVDLTEARISVQLDVGKRSSPELAKTMSSGKDHQSQCPGRSRTIHDVGSSYETADHVHKRPRTKHI